MARLTTFSKLLITVVIVAALVFGAKYLIDSGILGGGDSDDPVDDDGYTEQNANLPARSSDDLVRIGVVTWGGYAGGQYFNRGFKPNPQSEYRKQYGLDVEFVILDDFVASRQAFKNGDVDLLWATIDAFPTEAGTFGEPVQVAWQADWSRGGDAIVVRRGINSVADLKGKKIAVAELTPSHTFLLWLLDAGDLTEGDVELVKFANAIDAAQAFKSRQVDAAVVWSPDDEAALAAVPGSRVLQSTRSASNIIADVFLVKQSYLENNRQKLQNLYEGWMKGAAEINSSDAAKREAAQILADNFEGFSTDDTYAAINNVRLTNHGDNLNFFGQNSNYNGVTAEDLYTRMANEYQKLGYIDGRPPSYRTVVNSSLVRSASLSGAGQEPEEGRNFAEAAAAGGGETAEAISNKQVSIQFPTGSATLGENAKNLIDVAFVDIAKAFSNARIRIEGNTDNVGNRASNIALSEKRANAVRDYLVKVHGMQPARFVIVGNGPDDPVASNDTAEGRAKNRRTDFQLLAE